MSDGGKGKGWMSGGGEGWISDGGKGWISDGGKGWMSDGGEGWMSDGLVYSLASHSACRGCYQGCPEGLQDQKR